VTHLILLSGLILMLFPMYLVFVAASLTLKEVSAIPPHILPGDQLWVNIEAAWVKAKFGAYWEPERG
jgi:sn-glycerol 3-phosphate transport system permease protein